MTVAIAAVIPAHMASVRFPGKILQDIHGLPMIEHVRRRALLCNGLSSVWVATCDHQIADVIKSFGGDVIFTSNVHTNGTSRVNEAVNSIECSHVIVLQGDEPLLLPRHINSLVEVISTQPQIEAWNLTGSIENSEELDRHSFVKCIVSKSNRILHCFRRSPFYSSTNGCLPIVRKILGVIAYRKSFLKALCFSDPTPIEALEFIEQMRILETDHFLYSLSVEPGLPSVNEPLELDIVLNYLAQNIEQLEVLKAITI